MSILIGGSGSAGTTLLRVRLNNHPDLFSGTELNFFNKKVLFDDWNKFKSLVIPPNKSIATDGWFPYPGTNLLDDDFKWSANDLSDLIDSSEDIKSFTDSFFKRSLTYNNAKVWVEKTPSNAYCFENFLKQFNHGKVIHVVRNPYDAVASLVSRGMSEFFATGIWVYNNSAALTTCESDRYLSVFYEDLISNPNEGFQNIYRFIGVPAVQTEKPILKANTTIDGFSSWGSDPYSDIKPKTISKFDTLNKRQKERIIYALDSFYISSKNIKNNSLEFSNCYELCKFFGYEYKVAKKSYFLSLGGQLLKDAAKRTVKGYPTRPPNYIGRVKISPANNLNLGGK